MTLLIQDNKENFSLQGELTFKNAQLLYQEKSLFVGLAKIYINLEKVRHCDSAGLSVLIAWHNLAIQNGCSLHYLNIPKQLYNLIRIYGIENFWVNHDK